MAGQARTRSFSPIAALGAVLALVLALSGVWTGTAPGARGASDPAGTPFGHLDGAVAVPGGIQVWGWAIDPDTTGPIYVWVTLDGTGRHWYANAPRPDVAAAYPGSGPDHGFASVLATTPGAHRVCVTAANVGYGAHKSLGCRTVTVRAGSPLGNYESARVVSGGIEVTGWAIDPDTTGPIYVWVTLDGVGRHLFANQARPDVAAAYPGYGPTHGFTGTLTAPAGTHTVCVTASNVGAGAHTPLGCRILTVVPVGSPFGNLESVRSVTGGIEVQGWAIDPDTAGPIYVWVTVDGIGRHLLADAPRPDVAGAYPSYGTDHGFTGTLAAPAGSRTVCVTASNVGPGAHRVLGCRSILNIRAYIDGRSELVLKGDTVYWHHLDYDAPGRHAGEPIQPTYVNRLAWNPSWPDIPDSSNGFCNCNSSTFVGAPRLPRAAQTLELEIIQSREGVHIVQNPSSGNNYTAVVEFDDNAPGGPEWYEVNLYYNAA